LARHRGGFARSYFINKAAGAILGSLRAARGQVTESISVNNDYRVIIMLRNRHTNPIKTMASRIARRLFL
jgi:hypothetical protein